MVKGTDVQLWIGQADYRVGQAGAWSDAGELDRQLALNRKYPQVTGSVHFSAKSMRSDALGSVTRYAANFYATPALPPIMAQLPADIPAPPRVERVRHQAHLEGQGHELGRVPRAGRQGQPAGRCAAAATAR